MQARRRRRQPRPEVTERFARGDAYGNTLKAQGQKTTGLQHFTPLQVQLPAAQSAVHVAPASQLMVQAPGPPQFMLHVAPFSHVIVQLPAWQLKVQSAPAWHVCAHDFPSPSQLPVQTLPSAHVIAQPGVVQF